MSNTEESSFSKGVGVTFGVVFALFLLFVVMPCAMCGGCAMVGSIGSGDYEAQQVDVGEK